MDWEAPLLSALANSVIVHACVHACASINTCVCVCAHAHEVYLCVCVQAERFCPLGHGLSLALLLSAPDSAQSGQAH